MLQYKITRSAIAAISLNLVITLLFATTLKAQQVLGLERLRNAIHGGHFYTTDPREVYDHVRGAGFVHEGSLGVCISRKTQDTTALYRLVKPGQDRLYTIYSEEVESAKRSGYSYENVPCYVYRSYSRVSPCEIYRLYNPKKNYHFYTTDKREADSAIRIGYR